jgi:hypothetical protein
MQGPGADQTAILVFSKGSGATGQHHFAAFAARQRIT